jgi:hypothetical protein
MRWASLIITSLVLVGATAAAACDGGKGYDSSGHDGERRGSDLIARPDVPFQVSFESVDPYSLEPRYFVWTQGKGMRRWDLVTVREGKPIGGSFSIETDFEEGVTLGWPTLGCLWGTGDFPPDHVLVGCSSSTALVFSPIEDALYSLIDQTLSNRTIAGRNASCYTFTHPDYSLGAFCVDSSQGIPLLFTTESLVDSLFSQSMEAIWVSTAEEELGVPLGLEGDPVEGFPGFEDVLPISELLLPDLSEFLE